MAYWKNLAEIRQAVDRLQGRASAAVTDPTALEALWESLAAMTGEIADIARRRTKTPQRWAKRL